MQTTNAVFDQGAIADAINPSWQLRISWDKAFDDAVTFFTLDTSLLDGVDVLAPSDNNVVQEWDKYEYADYSDRVIGIEITREELEPFSVVQSFADITLNNYDDYFTQNSGSPIDTYILPKRPVRILLGFKGQNLPQFIGLTEKLPQVDKKARTAKIHMMDFLSFLFTKKIDNTSLLENYSTGEILAYLLDELGLAPDQYNFTSTSFNRIPYFFVEKDQNFGDVVRELMKAEQGRLYMTEDGVITFQNRQDYPTTPVWTFNKENTNNYEVSGEDDLINFVDLTSEILDEMQEQSVWTLAERTLVRAGQSVDIWSSYSDPVTTVTTPTYSPITVGASYFRTTEDAEGQIPYTSISLDSITNFSKASKLTFENTGTTDAYVVSVDIWGTPVKVVDTIRVQDIDQTSIDKYEEARYELETKYIQKRSDAISKAAVLLDDYKDIGSILDIDVKGNPALQIGDPVTVDLDGYDGEYTISKIFQSLHKGLYVQQLKVKQRDIRSYFIISSDSEARSLLGGTDVLVP